MGFACIYESMPYPIDDTIQKTLIDSAFFLIGWPDIPTLSMVRKRLHHRRYRIFYVAGCYLMLSATNRSYSVQLAITVKAFLLKLSLI